MQKLPKRLASSGAKKIRRRLESISAGKVLDVATGDGDFIHTLMKTLKDYRSFVGIDASKKQVKAARKRFQRQRAKIMQMNGAALKFENGCFNTVCISHSLHHLDRVDKVLAEMKRALKPGGLFIIQEMYRDGEQTEAQKTDILVHHWQAKIDSLLGFNHSETSTKQKITDTVASLRLKESEIFESACYVKCLFCKQRFECGDPKNETIINRSIEEIEDNMRRLEEDPDLKMHIGLREEGEKLKERIRKFGSAPASHLFYIGRK